MQSGRIWLLNLHCSEKIILLAKEETQRRGKARKQTKQQSMTRLKAG
jgi:hypothetical protein